LRSEVRPYTLHGVYLGRFLFLVCTICYRVYHPERTSQDIETAARAKGLWGARGQPERVEAISNWGQRVRHFLVLTLGHDLSEPETTEVGRSAEERSKPRPTSPSEPFLAPLDVAEPTSNAK